MTKLKFDTGHIFFVRSQIWNYTQLLQPSAKLRNEKHGSCEAALGINDYQKVGLINPFARATIDSDFVFSIWLFDSVDLEIFKDFKTLTLICDDLIYSAELKLKK